MCANKLLSYNPKLKELARKLRKNSTLAEVILWQNIKGKVFDYEFHRQVPINDFIVDFFCHELQLAIEIDGNTHDYNF
jgi:very-short-patch-repair endonuclease